MGDTVVKKRAKLSTLMEHIFWRQRKVIKTKTKQKNQNYQVLRTAIEKIKEGNMTTDE